MISTIPPPLPVPQIRTASQAVSGEDGEPTRKLARVSPPSCNVSDSFIDYHPGSHRIVRSWSKWLECRGPGFDQPLTKSAFDHYIVPYLNELLAQDFTGLFPSLKSLIDVDQAHEALSWRTVVVALREAIINAMDVDSEGAKSFEKTASQRFFKIWTEFYLEAIGNRLPSSLIQVCRPNLNSVSLSDYCNQLIAFLRKLEYSEVFEHPVTEQIAPQYFSIISHPMCISDIERKHMKHVYQNRQQVDEDVELIYSNCISYNNPDYSPLPSIAENSFRAASRFMKRFVVETRLESDSLDRTPLSSLLFDLLAKLQEFDAMHMFSAPVSDLDIPFYSFIIERPIDFSLMKKRIELNIYQSISDFSADFIQMCENGLNFNASESPFHYTAKTLRQQGKSLLRAASKTATIYSDEISDDPMVPLYAAPNQRVFIQEQRISKLFEDVQKFVSQLVSFPCQASDDDGRPRIMLSTIHAIQLLLARISDSCLLFNPSDTPLPLMDDPAALQRLSFQIAHDSIVALRIHEFRSGLMDPLGADCFVMSMHDFDVGTSDTFCYQQPSGPLLSFTNVLPPLGVKFDCFPNDDEDSATSCIKSLFRAVRRLLRKSETARRYISSLDSYWSNHCRTVAELFAANFWTVPPENDTKETLKDNGEVDDEESFAFSDLLRQLPMAFSFPKARLVDIDEYSASGRLKLQPFATKNGFIFDSDLFDRVSGVVGSMSQVDERRLCRLMSEQVMRWDETGCLGCVDAITISSFISVFVERMLLFIRVKSYVDVLSEVYDRFYDVLGALSDRIDSLLIDLVSVPPSQRQATLASARQSSSRRSRRTRSTRSTDQPSPGLAAVTVAAQPHVSAMIELPSDQQYREAHDVMISTTGFPAAWPALPTVELIQEPAVHGSVDPFVYQSVLRRDQVSYGNDFSRFFVTHGDPSVSALRQSICESIRRYFTHHPIDDVNAALKVSFAEVDNYLQCLSK